MFGFKKPSREQIEMRQRWEARRLQLREYSKEWNKLYYDGKHQLHKEGIVNGLLLTRMQHILETFNDSLSDPPVLALPGFMKRMAQWNVKKMTEQFNELRVYST